MSSTQYLGSGQRIRQTEGAVVIVTGAGGGIGMAIARRLLHDGWSIVATDLATDSMKSLAADFPKTDRLRIEAINVSQRADIDRVAALLTKADARVAGLVNVAGLLQDVTPFFKLDVDAQRKLWDVNYFGAQHCLQVFAAMMSANSGGAVVNITSINELRPLPLHAYAPSKVALGALTQLAAGELGPLGVRVNAVAPGFTLTPIFRDKLESGKRDAEVLKAHTPLGRLVNTDEIAAAVSFLLSDDASAITGVCLPVDGGWLAASHWMNFRDLM